MMNYMQFLVATRASLQDKKSQKNEPCDRFAKGKLVLSTAEIQRLDFKIRESLQQFNLYSKGHFTIVNKLQCDSSSHIRQVKLYYCSSIEIYFPSVNKLQNNLYF